MYELTVYLTEALISAIFLLNMLTAKYNKFIQILLWLAIVLVVMFVTPSFSLVRIGAITVVEFLYTHIVYENKLQRKCAVFLFKELILLISSGVAYTIYAVVVDKHSTFLMGCKSENCTYCLLYLVLFSVFSSIVFQIIKDKKAIELPWVVSTLLISGAGTTTSVLAVASAEGGIINSKESILIIVGVTCMVIANLSVGILAPYLLLQVSKSNRMDYGEELSNMEYKYYEMSVENDKRIMEIKHDISNHIQTVYSLIDRGDTDNGLALMDELRSRYTHVDQIVYCNNSVINIILANKKSEAEANNIETHIKIKDSLDNIPITDFDISTVICNLLDNAIRGCINSEQSNPRMVIEILQKNQHIVVRVLNSCKINMVVESTDRIETTKSKTQTHGLGMPIVAEIARKYHGDFVASAQNGIFTATVVMSVKEK